MATRALLAPECGSVEFPVKPQVKGNGTPVTTHNSFHCATQGMLGITYQFEGDMLIRRIEFHPDKNNPKQLTARVSVFTPKNKNPPLIAELLMEQIFVLRNNEKGPEPLEVLSRKDMLRALTWTKPVFTKSESSNNRNQILSVTLDLTVPPQNDAIKKALKDAYASLET